MQADESSTQAVAQSRNTGHTTCEAKSIHGSGALVYLGSRRHLRGRRGGLKDMPEMPLDVLFEIFGFLHSRDLLSLARATREFRALLMSRQSAPFWREARRLIEDLPDPPSYLSEPAFANLLFSVHCHNCCKPNVQAIYWTFSVRYCDPCQKAMFADETEVSAFLMEAFQYASDLYVNSRYDTGRSFGRQYHIPEIGAVRRQWAALRDDAERARFKADRAAFVAESQKYCKLLSLWQVSCKGKRSKEVCELKRERFEAVKCRLHQEGFGDVLSCMKYMELTGLKRMSSVNRASKLTDKGWKSIRTSVVQYMTPIHDRYLKARTELTYRLRLGRLRDLLDDYHHSNTPRTPSSDCEPGFCELATLPAIQTLLQDRSSDVVQELQILPVDFPSLMISWTEHHRNVFVELALRGLGESSASLELDTLLDLALVSFVCKRCHRRQLRWPHLLSHRCFRDRSEVHPKSVYEVLASHQMQSDHDAPYRGEELAVFDDHVAVTHSIISLCGLAPDTATYKDVEDAGATLVCWLCMSESPGQCQVFDWQTAIRHSIISHSTEGADPASFWERLLPVQTVQAHALERTLVQQNNTLSQNPINVFGCTRCPSHGSVVVLMFHFLCVHGLVSPELGEDMYLHEDSKPCGAPSVWIDLSARRLCTEVQAV
ncbi:hypothetical protein BD309DRAFT_955402 [Dichomitus squalens]|nr:hypothetical protein BD309DRAFT_955402 [Dichomitus squalens]